MFWSLTTHYDANGNLTETGVLRPTVDGLAERKLWRYSYDQANRRYATAKVDGSNTAFDTAYTHYDARGQVIATRTAVGYVIRYEYDTQGNKSRETDALNRFQSWTYDVYGKLASRLELGGREHRFRYDAHGQQQREELYASTAVDATLLGHKNFYYWENGALAKQDEDARQLDITETVLDASGHRVFRRTVDQYQSFVEYRYDIAGQRTWSREYHHNQHGQTFRGTTWLDENGEPLGEPEEYNHGSIETVHNERVTTTAYDELGRVSQVSAPAQQQQFSVEGDGPLQWQALSNGLVALSYRYDAADNRINIRAEYSKSGAGGSPNQEVQDHWYRYDADNRIVIAQGQLNATTQQVELAQGRGSQFTYDAIGQRSYALSWVKDTEGLNNVLGGYGRLNYRLHRYTYSDVGQLTLTEERYSNSATSWSGGDANIDPNASALTARMEDYGESSSEAIYGLRYAKKQERVVDDWGNVRELTEYLSADYGPKYRRGHLQGNTTNAYNADGQLLESIRTDTKNRITSIAHYIDHEVGGQFRQAYDASGRLLNHYVDMWQADGQYHNKYGHSNFYSSQLLLQDGYLETQTKAESWTNEHEGTDAYADNHYDVWGRLTRATGTGSNVFDRRFLHDHDGHISTRFDVDGTTIKTQDTFYLNGQHIGVVGKINPEGGEQHYAEFDLQFAAISPQYPAAVGSDYVVQETGETLQSVAQGVWGDSKLWYLIADANGLDLEASLTAGQRLKLPNVVTNVHNDNETFKPYNPDSLIGDRTPLPVPDEGKGCNKLAMLVMVVIAIVVTIFTAGAAATLFVGASQAIAGTAVLAGTAAIGAGATMAAAFVGGVVGSAASQLAGKAMGVVEHFSLRQAVASGLTASFAAGAGVAMSGATQGGALIDGANKLTTAGSFAQGAAAYVGSYAANKLAGIDDTHFSLRGLGAGMAATYLSNELFGLGSQQAGSNSANLIQPSTIRPFEWSNVIKDAGLNFVRSGIDYAARKAFNVKDTHWDGDVTAWNGFSSAVGNNLGGHIDDEQADTVNREQLKNASSAVREEYDYARQSGMTAAEAMDNAKIKTMTLADARAGTYNHNLTAGLDGPGQKADTTETGGATGTQINETQRQQLLAEQVESTQGIGWGDSEWDNYWTNSAQFSGVDGPLFTPEELFPELSDFSNVQTEMDRLALEETMMREIDAEIAQGKQQSNTIAPIGIRQLTAKEAKFAQVDAALPELKLQLLMAQLDAVPTDLRSYLSGAPAMEVSATPIALLRAQFDDFDDITVTQEYMLARGKSLGKFGADGVAGTLTTKGAESLLRFNELTSASVDKKQKYLPISTENSSKEEIYKLLLDSEVKAFLAVLKQRESGGAYNVINGGNTFDSYDDHPRVSVKYTTREGKAWKSSAAGAYQFQSGTWDEIAKKYELQDFTADNQDFAAVVKLKSIGSIKELKAGNLEAAIFKAATVWDAFPLNATGISISKGKRPLAPIVVQYNKLLVEQNVKK